jgi:N-methylhydantoinase A
MFKVCIDVGGTFSESVVLDEKGEFHEFKSPTTPQDLSIGVLNTLVKASNSSQMSLGDFLDQTEWIIHGTTIATNALVQRKLSRTAMVTTRGFRDIIEMRRSLKIETKSMYEAFIPPYEPIIPRHLRFPVSERTKASGEVVKSVDEAELRQVIERIKKENVESVAVCFVNSYVNQRNEREAAEMCSNLLRDVYVTYSSDILPKMGEYERFSTAVINASIGPIVKNYLNALEAKLRQEGFRGQLLIVQANQYVQSISAIVRKPVYLVGSGPAAGSAGAIHLGKFIREPNLLVGDMGGTAWDASIVKKGQVSLKSGEWLGDDRIGIKVAEVRSIGAGGGSIGWVNPLGLLQMGPQSAGAEPGPACYGRGGSEATTTDAALIMGYLNPDNFLGGKFKIDPELARRAMRKVAEPLKMTLEEAAEAMCITVNANMADAIAEISTRRGYDVRDFALLAVGGGGPLCGVLVADVLGVRKTIVPRFSASFCAWSMFFLDIGRDYVRSYLCRAEEAQPDAINKLFSDMLADAMADFEDFKVSTDDIVIEKSADMCYADQYHMLEVKLPEAPVTRQSIQTVCDEFHQKHKELYTFSLKWVAVEFHNLRLIAKVRSSGTPIKEVQRGTPDASKAILRRRDCYFNGQWVNTPIYDGQKLRKGNTIPGTAIIEEPTTTTVIPAGHNCQVDDFGNFLIVRNE